jgi:hypothetical protein
MPCAKAGIVSNRLHATVRKARARRRNRKYPDMKLSNG